MVNCVCDDVGRKKKIGRCAVRVTGRYRVERGREREGKSNGDRGREGFGTWTPRMHLNIFNMQHTRLAN